MTHPELILLFLCIAAVYASAGFGGGSSYLAALALLGFSAATMRPLALLCNVVVVLGNTWVFHQNHLIDWRRSLPLLFASVPMAFLGGYLPVREREFLLLLGGSLVVAALLLFFQNSRPPQTQTPENQSFKPQPTSLPINQSTNQPARQALVGGGIGLLSGMVGIGGGIFLAPVLHLWRWAAPKTIAATASLFILVNSLAGLAGQFAQKQAQIDWSLAGPLMGAVLVGGQIGSSLTAVKLPQHIVRITTAVLTLYAGGHLIINNL